MVRRYFRPILTEGEGLPLAGGPFSFARAEVLTRAGSEGFVDADALPADWQARLTAPRPLLARFAPPMPLVMGIINVTPDSFSDGGRHDAPAAAIAAAHAMHAAGAAIIDVGAESTRPGAPELPVGDELARLAPLWGGLAGLPVSIDTRKAAVMEAALAAGAMIVNDVSALGHDPDAMALVAARGCPVILMHHQGTPETMQIAPHYDNVLLDVFDWLEGRIAAAVAAGIAPDAVIADPGIGFGKGLAHNLALLWGLTLLHGLGVPILLGASRKSLISKLAGDVPVEQRLPGSLALALAGAEAGVQIVRVHDVAETAQALAVWRACRVANA
ncbi:dihydropteroate synthase [Sandarakinorhabdus oryzae]|uniref:dihydropteroate synthase n=1 Tax=Sandarakinorhabdus oryzae TaxID=2675220 RepID=UPI0012E20956|nr:dihydropteroate synthase [Sandarakinorhabdus oryzae]